MNTSKHEAPTSSVAHQPWCDLAACDDSRHRGHRTVIGYRLVGGAIGIVGYDDDHGGLSGGARVRAELEHTELEASLDLELSATEARDFARQLLQLAECIERNCPQPAPEGERLADRRSL